MTTDGGSTSNYTTQPFAAGYNSHTPTSLHCATSCKELATWYRGQPIPSARQAQRPATNRVRGDGHRLGDLQLDGSVLERPSEAKREEARVAAAALNRSYSPRTANEASLN